MMTVRKSMYGKLPESMLADLDGLLLKLRRINRKGLKGQSIKASDIRALPEDENSRLWGYLRHCCTMVAGWPNISKAIAVMASRSNRDFANLREECIDSMTIHVYTYAWRKYRHSSECGLVFKTAEFGYKSWISSQNVYEAGTESFRKQFEDENPSCGRKVSVPSSMN